jgi:DUF971 family protein
MDAPISITRPRPWLLHIIWPDMEADILLEHIRADCPCAACQGEEIMGQRISFGMKLFMPGMNELTALQAIGNYGVQAFWKDGHSTGIYTWKVLRSIAEKHALAPEELSALIQKEQNQTLGNEKP